MARRHRKLLTIHAPLAPLITDETMDTIGERMRERGLKWWVSADGLPDIVIMIEEPDNADELAQGRGFPSQRVQQRLQSTWPK